MMNRDDKREYNRLYAIANKERLAAKREARRAGIGENVRRCGVPGCRGVYDAAGYCARHYMAWRRHGDPTKLVQNQLHGKTLAERIAAYTQRTRSCWKWTGVRNPKGYGLLHVGESNRLAHRVAWELEHGAIPAWQYVLHRCDNPACVRPAHLFLGTKGENNADMVAKKRHRTKLAEADVRAIRGSVGTHTAVGQTYGVSRVLVSRIRSGQAWKHLK